jgi:hypothetical protein
MSTTLTNIHNYAGTGTLSNGNLTISSTGNSTVQTTTAITDKRTFEVTISAFMQYWAIFGMAVDSFFSPTGGFYISYNANWEIVDPTGSTVVTGPSTPAVSAGMILSVSVDPIGKTITVKANGTAVFTNQNISTWAPTTWKAILWGVDASQSGYTFSTTGKFSGLTYAPPAGYAEWDATGNQRRVSLHSIEEGFTHGSKASGGLHQISKGIMCRRVTHTDRLAA